VAPLLVATFLSPRLEEAYRSAAREAAGALGREARLVTDASFEDLDAGAVDAAFLCGLPYVELRELAGDRLEALAAPVPPGDRYGGAPVYFSDVVVRRGDPARGLGDLRGRRWAYNEERSHSGHNVVLATLARRGADPGMFSEVTRTGSHEGSLDAVRSGRADGAAVDSHLLDLLLAGDGALRESITVIESLGPSPSQPLAAGPGLREDERDAVRRAVGALPGWAPVRDSDYEPLRAMRSEALSLDRLQGA
jgi:ABC-type phosphate/phosphonate transport system substrate-binding protein